MHDKPHLADVLTLDGIGDLDSLRPAGSSLFHSDQQPGGLVSCGVPYLGLFNREQLNLINGFEL